MEPLSRATRDDQSKGKPEPKRVANPADTITEQMELNQDSIRSDDTTTVKVQEMILGVSICPDNREAN